MQTLRKKTSPCKYKNEPSRFLGEGVSFKAKLIGILEVSEARGDRMCQEALSDLKMAIRAAGEHKQRININIAIDGLRLRDEKTGDCLYHHPVHKISFIAQDMSDSRAFGYIFGSPDTGHRFFGIKTDKAASQVVIAMRDLFQVVFELKKKEIEMAKQHIEQHQHKAAEDVSSDSTSGPKGDQAFRKMKTIQEDSGRDEGHAGSEKPAQQTSEVIADLLDLEFELNNIQQGIHQMERITPCDPFGPPATGKSDPFGDSFTPAVSSPSPPARPQATVTLLPPPPSARDSAPRTAEPFRQTGRPAGRRGVSRQVASEPQDRPIVDRPIVDKPSPGQQPAELTEKHWFDRETEALFEEGELTSPQVSSVPTAATSSTPDKAAGQNASVSPPKLVQSSSHLDVFMELDPLGTGRNKPYVDRKDFFQELKNPPKKVLKDLVTEAPNEATAPLFKATFDAKPPASIQTFRGLRSPGNNTASTCALNAAVKTTVHEGDPFPTSDPFEDDSFVPISSVATSVGVGDPFNTDFADFTTFISEGSGKTVVAEADSMKKSKPLQQSTETITSKADFHGPLRVSLPPEKETVEIAGTALPDLKGVVSSAPSPSVSLKTIRSRTSKFQKQMTTSDIIRLPSPKTQQILADLQRQKSFDICGRSSTISRLTSSPTPPLTALPGAVERLSPSRNESEHKMLSYFPSKVASFPESPDNEVSSSAQLSRADHSEIAPEPPPRPATNIMAIKPPPLPPKRQQASEMVKPPPRPPHIDEHAGYDYIDEYKTSVLQHAEDMNKIPLTIPLGTLQFDEFEGGISLPRRPKKEPYVAPKDYVPSFPTLPQPSKKLSAASTEKVSLAAVTTIESFLQTSTSGITYSAYETQHKMPHKKASLDITLNQLTKTGLTDLAQTLGVSTDRLSKMTLQDFTAHIAKLTAFSQSVEENGEENKSEIQNIKREKYLTLRESVDEEPMFKAEFENNFDNSQVNEKFEDVFQNPSFDKYAVFRELIEQESKEESSAPPDENKTSLLDLEENFEENPKIKNENDEYSRPHSDRYAALRQIWATSSTITSCDEEIQVEEQLHTISQQDDSGSFDDNFVREPTSIIETTIEEEDITAIESEDTKSPEKLSMAKKPEVPMGKMSSPETKYEHQIIQTDIVDIITSDHEMKKAADENVATSEEDTKSPVVGWAKFDMKQLTFERPQQEISNEEAASPWSSDGKELMKIPSLWQEEFSAKSDKSHKSKQQTSPWKEDEGEESWEDVTQHPQHENGWSDGESFYDEMVHMKERRARRKKVSPWKDRKIYRDISPLERKKRAEEIQHWKGMWKRCKDHSMDEEEDEEEYDYSRSRPRHRGPSWDDERRRRHGSVEFEGEDYDYGPKQRPSPWRVERERRGSWESGSWDEEDRFSQREYADRWSRNEEEEYRRRCEADESRYYGRSRKYSGGSEGDYGHPEYVGRRRHRNYRDRSRESPWEEDFSEHDREDSMRYRSKKKNWPVRPNSASETRRTADKHSPGDYKPRQGPCGGKVDTSDKAFPSEWRYRDKGARPRSRESYFNSDQEYDFWPPHKSDKMLGHEQRSQTLQMRRNRRYRRPHEYSYSQKSPFDDDFSLQSFEIPDINSKDPCPNTSDQSLKSSEELIHNASEMPPQDPSKLKTDSTPEIDASQMLDSPYSVAEAQQNEDAAKPQPTKPVGNRQSPFEDDFTLPETHTPNTSKRYTSSLSSEVSDYLRSPFEEAQFAGRIESVAEEPACDSDTDVKNGKEIDDVFLPVDNAPDGLPAAQRFRMEDAAFLDGATIKSRALDKQVAGSAGGGEDPGRAEKPPPHMKTRLSLLRADSTSSLRKSESVNIFVRETDPFDDDFFDTNEGTSSMSDSNSSRRRDRSKANSDTSKWTNTFDFFDFEEGQ